MASVTTTSQTDPPALRDRLAARIAAVAEEQARYDAFVAAREHCAGQRRDVERLIDEAGAKLDALRREAPVARAYAYLNSELQTDLRLSEVEATTKMHRSKVERLDEIDQALAGEIAASAARLGDRERERRLAVSDIVVADPAFRALLDDDLDAAWARLRSVMVAIAVVAEVAPLPSLMLAKSQAKRPLATNVLVPVPNGFEPVTVD